MSDSSVFGSAPTITRVYHTFDIPEPFATKYGIKSVKMAELTASEEVMAARRQPNNQYGMALELVKTSIREINGQIVSVMDGSADRAFETMPQPVRGLVVKAYNSFSEPDKDLADAFQQSEKVEVL